MKKVLISIVTFIVMLSMVSIVYAVSGSISASSSSDTVIKGKTFTVVLAGTADSPIDGMKTKFVYDKNVLSLESAVPGQNYGNNSTEGEILVTSNADTSPTSTTLYTITFKVLETANVDSTEITFSESELHLQSNDTIEKVSTKVDDVVVNIKADDTTVGNQNQEDDKKDENTGVEDKEEQKTPSNTNSGNKSNSSTSTTNKNNTTKNKTTKLPQTGIENFSILAIIALGAISIASYISYRKYKNI